MIEGYSSKQQPVLFEGISVRKRLGNFQIKETKEAWPLNATHEPGLDSGIKKDCYKGCHWDKLVKFEYGL